MQVNLLFKTFKWNFEPPRFLKAIIHVHAQIWVSVSCIHHIPDGHKPYLFNIVCLTINAAFDAVGESVKMNEAWSAKPGYWDLNKALNGHRKSLKQK